jgi:hypothetical protein
VDGTLPLAIRVATVKAAARLGGCVGTVVMAIDLAVVINPLLWRLLLRATARHFKKL